MTGPARPDTGTSATPQAAPPTLTNLDPGGPAAVTQDVPVAIVYVGLHPGTTAKSIDAPSIEASLPSESTPRVRFRGYAGDNVPVGITYHYAYHSVFADQAFEDAFFGYLTSIALGPIPPTIFQQAYSEQPGAKQQITQDLVIDAISAETWLVTHGSALGVDTSKPTVFYVNWFGRPDFVFHTYASFNRIAPNPYPYGFTDQGQMEAWGGSTTDDPAKPLPQLGRVWFYDVSAGPDFRTANWDLTDSEVAGGFVNRKTEDRIPPIWEYGTSHWFRPFTSLSNDLARVTRFVALDTLFTSSPVGNPDLSPPLLVDDVNLDVNYAKANPAHTDLFGDLDMTRVLGALSALDPTRHYTSDTQEIPWDEATKYALSCIRAVDYVGGECLPYNYAGQDQDMDSFLTSRADKYLDGTRYEVPIAYLDLPPQWYAGLSFSGSAGFDTHGIPWWVKVVGSDRGRQNLSPATATMTHEVGHALGLSHPHDGYDSQLGVDFNGVDDFFIAQLGDESNTVMSYQRNTRQFSQFDRDNLARWLTAERIQWADRILADIYASPNAGAASSLLSSADAHAGDARAALENWDLPGASAAADAAYNDVVAAAGVVGVTIESWNARQDEGQTGRDAWRQNPVLHGATLSTKQVTTPMGTHEPEFLNPKVPPGYDPNQLTPMPGVHS